jgi:hypothetical protein
MLGVRQNAIVVMPARFSEAGILYIYEPCFQLVALP